MKFRWILLSILNSGRRTGYDVKQIVDDELGHFWHVTAPQIYGELKKLESLGWVTKEVGPSKRGPQRHYFKLTDTGISALRAALYSTSGEIESKDEWKCLWWVISKAGNKQNKVHFLNQLISDKESRLLKLKERIAISSSDPESHLWDEFLSGWAVSELENSVQWAKDALEKLSILHDEPSIEDQAVMGAHASRDDDEYDSSSSYDPFAGLNDSTLL